LVEQYKAEVNFKLEQNVPFDEAVSPVKQLEVFKLVTDLSDEALDILLGVIEQVNSKSNPRGEKEYRNLCSLLKLKLYDFCFSVNQGKHDKIGDRFGSLRTPGKNEGIFLLLAD
jgi:hypothetical protein